MSVDADTLSESEQKEIDQAAQTAESVEDPARNVRNWLLSTKTATLCTSASKAGIEGYPFGSVVPFAVDRGGHPLVLIADIAAHTANLRKDPRATIFVSDPNTEGDPQSSWRVGLIGQMQRILPEGKESKYAETSQVLELGEYEDIHARYVERVPKAAGYLKQHSFDYWRMNDLVTVRYIAGFGKICWIEGDRIVNQSVSTEFTASAEGAVEHMNEDHAANMIEMCTGLYGITPESAQMKQLSTTGFIIQSSAPDHKLYFSFGREIDESEIRTSVIGVLKKARSTVNNP